MRCRFAGRIYKRIESSELRVILLLFVRLFEMMLLVGLLLLFVFRGSECAQDCSKNLKDAELSPRYTGNVPVGDLKIIYDESHEAECGNELPILVTSHAPMVIYDMEGKCENVSIISFDPDVPLPAVSHLFLHWFVTNIPAEDLRDGYVGQDGDEQASYFPPLGATGNHRYTFCVYCQTEYIEPGKHYDLITRMGVSPRCLAKQNRLKEPEACNFFYLTAIDTKVLEDVPLVKELSDINKDLGNTDKTSLV